MEQLSSCYFCSSALDRPLETYSVSGGEAAVTLCSTCQRKLDHVLELVGTDPLTPLETEDPDAKTLGDDTAVDETADKPADTKATADVASDIAQLDERSTDAKGAEGDGGQSASVEDAGEDAAVDETAGSLDDSDDDRSVDTESESDDDFDDELGDDSDDADTVTVEGDGIDDIGTETIDGDDIDDTGGIDPSILQADEIVTGTLDIGDALSEEAAAELSDRLDDDSELTDAMGLGESADEDESTAVDEDEPIDVDVDEDEPIDVDVDEDGYDIDEREGVDDQSDSDSVESESGDEPLLTDDAEAVSDDGGFAFDQGSTTDDEDDITAAMEPDVPEEFDTAPVSQDAEDEHENDEHESDPLSFETDTAEGTSNEPTDSESDGPVSDEPASDEPTADTTTDESSAEDRDETGDDEAETATQPQANITALEYNRVMRLLQNREFPVDRDEILTVASSAYELSEAECNAVIDLAIDRELLAADGEKLVRPD